MEHKGPVLRPRCKGHIRAQTKYHSFIHSFTQNLSMKYRVRLSIIYFYPNTLLLKRSYQGCSISVRGYIYIYTQHTDTQTSPVIQVIFHSWTSLDQLTRPSIKIYSITQCHTQTSTDKLPWM